MWENLETKIEDMLEKDKTIVRCLILNSEKARAPHSSTLAWKIPWKEEPVRLQSTRGPYKKRQNLGIYRQQVIAPNKVIMRWLAHRGGALDFREHQLAHPGEPFPVAVALGADPATILGAVTPVPDTLSEYQFAGLLRGGRTEIVKCLSHDLHVPATAEIVLEGFIRPDAADPTGYE